MDRRRQGCRTVVAWVFLTCCASATGFKPILPPPPGYQHDRFNTEPDDHLCEFHAYTTSFDTADDDDGDGGPDLWRIPEWVAYELRKGEPGDFDRPSPWITDDTLHALAIAPDDDSYKHSGFSRGHMCMKDHAARLGANADHNTHTVLNACPQLQCMNGGVWLGLENKTAQWADKYGKVWIVCGPVFWTRKPSKFIGDEGELRVAVPDAFFKIVVKESGTLEIVDVLAFLIPQEGVENYCSTNHPLQPYLVSVDTIESLTGLDFLTGLPDDQEAALEKVVQIDLWPT